MGVLDDIERAVEKLLPEQLAAFSAWFERFEAERLDRRIAEDIGSGRLDTLADEALDDLRSGRARAL